MARQAAILLVEDSADDALLVSAAAEQTLRGVRVLRVPHGVAALQYLEGMGIYADRSTYPSPDIVLLDLKMPQMDGFQVLRWIRDHPKMKRLPVIILTGSTLERDSEQAYEIGANSYLVKPCDFNQLVETMKKLGEFWFGGTILPNTDQ